MRKFHKSCFPSNLLQRVAQNIKTENLIQQTDTILVAVSGGPDSIALLHLLLELKTKMFRGLGVAHLNHGLRSWEADRDADFVSQLCRRLNLRLHLKKMDVRKVARREKLNLEEAGRNCRYHFFNTIIKERNYSKVALAHHADDNAELVLMHLLRGSGMLGMSGMAFIRDHIFIRPLLNITRNDIMDYIKVNQLSYITDASNLDLRYTRNHIRHKLIPTLQRDYNPNITSALNTLATVARSEEEWMSRTTASIYYSALLNKNPDGITLSSNKLRQMHKAVARRVIRKALFELKGGLRRIGLLHIESILNLTDQEHRYRQLNLPGGLTIELEAGSLKFLRKEKKEHLITNNQSKDSTVSFSYDVIKPEDGPVHVYIGELDYYFKFSIMDYNPAISMSETGQNIAFFDMDLLVFPLAIRNPKPGDRFSPIGLNGSQKLKKFFINIKVPRSKRKSIPIVVSGENIIWIAGYRIGNVCKAHAQTKLLLKAEFFLPNPQQ